MRRVEGLEGFDAAALFVRPFPAAHVTVTFAALQLVGSVNAGPTPASALRARIVLAGRIVGTSRPLGAASVFDLAGEPMDWSRELRVFEGDSIAIAVQVVRPDLVPSKGTVASLLVGVGPPWAEGEQVFDDGTLRLTIQVETRRVPRTGLVRTVSRSAAGNPTPATIALRTSLVVEMLDVVGLYEPVDNPAPGELRARRRPAYTSEDNRGRIFTNRWYDGSFERNHQAIELCVRVRVARGFLPASVTLRWIVLDPDDPANEDVHPDAGPLLDPNDYDAALQELGTASEDNQGSFDRTPRFEAVGAYGLTVVSSSEAHTSVLDGLSRLRVHCPNFAGDNLIVRVEVLLPDGEHFAAETGVMTMWHRLDVEVVRMKRARKMPFDENAKQLEPACVQLDFAPERLVGDVPYMGLNEVQETANETSFYRRHSQHRTKPGWLFLAIVHHALPPTQVERWRGPAVVVPVGQASSILTMGHVPDARTAQLRWLAQGRSVTVRHSIDAIRRAGALGTEYALHRSQYSAFFRDGDFGPNLYGWPNLQDDGDGLTEGGFHAPKEVEVVLYAGNPVYAGTTLWSQGAGRPDGACYAFASALEELGFDELAPVTAAHELIHALSLPHACGRRNYLRDAVCSMHGRFKPLLRLDRGHATKPVVFDETLDQTPFGALCELHIRELRRVHVEDLSSYSWLYPPPRTGAKP